MWSRDILRPEQIRSTWSDYEEDKAKIQRNEEERRQRHATHAAVKQEVAQQLKSALDHFTNGVSFCDSGHYARGITVMLDTETAKKLADVLTSLENEEVK